MPRVETFRTEDAPEGVLEQALELCLDTFGSRYNEHDWPHALGGTHVVVFDEDTLVTHVSAVPRQLTVGAQSYRGAYVESVATLAAFQGRGLGSIAMQELNSHITSEYEFAALSTGAFEFYSLLGWDRWAGRSFVQTASQRVWSESDDAALMVLRFGASVQVDLSGDMTCPERPGDNW